MIEFLPTIGSIWSDASLHPSLDIEIVAIIFGKSIEETNVHWKLNETKSCTCSIPDFDRITNFNLRCQRIPTVLIEAQHLIVDCVHNSQAEYSVFEIERIIQLDQLRHDYFALFRTPWLGDSERDLLEMKAALLTNTLMAKHKVALVAQHLTAIKRSR